MISKGARHAVSHDAHSCLDKYTFQHDVISEMSNDIRFQKLIAISERTVFEFFEPDICDK